MGRYFEYAEKEKRYHTYDYYLKKAFGCKCAKIGLDGGFTCPNKDGTKGTGGMLLLRRRRRGDDRSGV